MVIALTVVRVLFSRTDARWCAASAAARTPARRKKNGLVQMTKRPCGLGPPRKFYALNDTGREELATFWAKWEYITSRIDKLKEGGR
ncbi:PadR family transcriptional regulator [Nonomuraea polychroma]|uniref:PadR family transcriptional regulator n=1 Tax=Nonomuraea polychroma TaxID=46176 RepID=UPI003D8C7293